MYLLNLKLCSGQIRAIFALALWAPSRQRERELRFEKVSPILAHKIGEVKLGTLYSCPYLPVHPCYLARLVGQPIILGHGLRVPVCGLRFCDVRDVLVIEICLFWGLTLRGPDVFLIIASEKLRIFLPSLGQTAILGPKVGLQTGFSRSC